MPLFGFGIFQLVAVFTYLAFVAASNTPRILRIFKEESDLLPPISDNTFWLWLVEKVFQVIFLTILTPVFGYLFFVFCAAAASYEISYFENSYDEIPIQLGGSTITLDQVQVSICLASVGFILGLLIFAFFKFYQKEVGFRDQQLKQCQVFFLCLLPISVLPVSIGLFLVVKDQIESLAGFGEFFLVLLPGIWIVLFLLVGGVGPWTIANLHILRTLKASAKARRLLYLEENLKNSGGSEFITIRDALIIEHGWDAHLLPNKEAQVQELLGWPNKIKPMSSHITSAPNQTDRSVETKIDEVFFEDREVIITAEPLWGFADSDFSEVVPLELTDTILKIENRDRVCLTKDKHQFSNEVRKRLIGGSLWIGNMLAFQQHVLIARKRLRDHGWLFTKLGW